MLVGSCLLVIIILSFGSPLIPASPHPSHPSHNAVKLNIFQIGCGHRHDRQDISIGTFYPVRYLPGSKNSLPCTPLTHAGVSCSMTRLHSDPLIIAVELKAKNCTGSPPHSRVSAGKPINETHTNETHTTQIAIPFIKRADIHVNPPRLQNSVAADYSYIKVKMHVDSTFTLIPGTLSLTKGTHVLPPSTGNAADLASAILPSATLANCANGFVFGTAKILHRKAPIPTDCIVAHTGVLGFGDHVVIGDGHDDYMTAEEIQQLPAPESRALVTAARNNLVFNNNMYTALSQAYTEAQLLVNDMKNDLLPDRRPPKIKVNLGDVLIIVGILLPTIPFGAWAPLAGVIGGSMVITGTLMNERPEEENKYDIVSDNRLQKMQDMTQVSFLKLMNATFYTDQKYAAYNHFYDGGFKGFTQMKAQIKQQAVAWSASQFLNYYGLKICDNPDDFPTCYDTSILGKPTCNSKIKNATTDCRLAGGFDHDGGGYKYHLLLGVVPEGNIVKFANYLPNGSYDDLCNNRNGWNISKGECSHHDF